LMIVLGVDSGSLCTGYGVVQSDGRLNRALDWGAIRNPPTATQAERITTIYKNLREIMRRFAPNIMALEGVFYCKNAQSALKLGQVRGVVLLAALEEGLEIREFSPAEVKLAVTGYGRAEKAQVQTMVKAILGLAKLPEPHDAADALALALCALNRQGGDRKVGLK
jgi:crossover junction endodeoxyribonuclease RuvC